MGIETLKDSLLRSLTNLPGSRTFHLYTLISEAVRDQDVFLYAAHRPKAHVRHILVLLVQHPSKNASGRVLTCAIEAFLYAIASSNSSILYISKVDSTGQGHDLRPNPTRTLVTAFIQHFITLANYASANLWIHVFARAQNQYLFPNSAEYAGKRVLRDVSLCKWWKEVLERAIQAREQRSLSLYYLLPGYSAFEAKAMLYKSLGPTASDAYPWVYSHPHNQTIAPWPCGAAPAEVSIAHLIPSLPDDPKARFLDEIASTPSEVPDSLPALPTSPRPPKRIRTSSPAVAASSKGPSSDYSQRQALPTDSNHPSMGRTRKGKAISVTPGAQRALASVPIDEFWERMGFRQECSQGAVTGFFTAIFASSATGASSSSSSSSGFTNWQGGGDAATIPGQQPTAVLERVISTLLNLDFGGTEQAIRATKVIEDSIRAMCGAASAQPNRNNNLSRSETKLLISDDNNTASSHPTAESSPGTERLQRHHDLGSAEEAVSTTTTTTTTTTVRRDMKDKQHPEGESLSQIDTGNNTLGTPGSSRDIDNNNDSRDSCAALGPFASFVYGSVTVENAPLPSPPPKADGAQPGMLSAGGGPVVTILQVRKKKRPAASS